jgi:hypothetical protein
MFTWLGSEIRQVMVDHDFVRPVHCKQWLGYQSDNNGHLGEHSPIIAYEPIDMPIRESRGVRKVNLNHTHPLLQNHGMVVLMCT